MTSRSGWVAIIVAGLVTACGGASAPSEAPSSSGASTPAIESSKPSAASAPVPSPSPSSMPEASAAAPVALGAVGVTPRGSRVTVHSFGPAERSVTAPAGAAWHEADLEWCLPPTIAGDVTLGNIRYELKLEMRDGTTIEPEAEADSPDEVYASDGTFSANECVRGPLVFAVPTGATPEYLLLVGSYGGMRWRLA